MGVRRPYTRLLLTGDRAGDEIFLRVVKDALGGLNIVAQVNERKAPIDFSYAVARGAAEFQRRRQQGWLDCVQPRYCGETSLWGKMEVKKQQLLGS